MLIGVRNRGCDATGVDVGGKGTRGGICPPDGMG